MTRIIDKTIQEYTGYMEHAQDDLYQCHPNDEPRMKAIVQAYENVLSALEVLNTLITPTKT